jgi:hypothetical protein
VGSGRDPSVTRSVTIRNEFLQIFAAREEPHVSATDWPAGDGRRSAGTATAHHMFELREERLPGGLADFSRTWTSAIDFFLSKIAFYPSSMDGNALTAI